MRYYNRTNVLDYVVDTNSMPPCGNCDYECLREGLVCPNITAGQKELFEAVCNAKITYYIVPNYCGFPCANFFGFNERSVGYFNKDKDLMEKYMAARKRFIVISNSEETPIQTAMEQQAYEPAILYLKSGKYGKQSIAGDILDCAEARADLDAFLNEAAEL